MIIVRRAAGPRGVNPPTQVLASKEQYELVKADREQAQTEVLAHGRVMAKLKREEVEAAERITDDHIHACEQGVSLGDMFPNIQVLQYSICRGARIDLYVCTFPARYCVLRSIYIWGCGSR